MQSLFNHFCLGQMDLPLVSDTIYTVKKHKDSRENLKI